MCLSFRMAGGKWSKAAQWSGPSSSTPEFLVRGYLFISSAHSLHLNFHFQHWLNNLPMENVKRARHKVLCEHTHTLWKLNITYSHFFIISSFNLLSVIVRAVCIYWDSFFSMFIKILDINWPDKRTQRSLLDKLNMFGFLETR